MKKRKLQRNKEEVIKRTKLGINQKANNTNNRANRGGNYNNNGSNNPASNRNNNNPTNTNSNNGSHPTLIQFLDYIFYGIYTMKVLVLKRFIPS